MARSFAEVAQRQLKTSAGKSNSRTRLIGAVHGAVRTLGLSSDDRKAIQQEVTGKASLTQMDLAEIGAVLDRLNKGRGITIRRGAPRPHISKIRALWWTLYWLGEVNEPNDSAIDSFVCRQTRISSLQFLDHTSAPSVIEALKYMAFRTGVIWPSAIRLERLQENGHPKLTMPLLERHAVLSAIWRNLLDARVVSGTTAAAYVAKAQSLCPDPYSWADTELDLAIRTLGKKLRRHLAKSNRNADL